MRPNKTAAIVGATLMLMVPGIAQATTDSLVADDATAFTTPRVIDFGDVCLGSTATANASIAIQRGDEGAGANAFGNGAIVTVSRTASPTSPITTTTAPGTITMPSEWVRADAGTFSPPTTDSFRFAPTSPGSVSRTVSYVAEGVNASNSGKTRTAATTLSLVGTGKDCTTDGTPPVTTPHTSGTQGTNGWYTSNVSVTFEVTDAQSNVTSTNGCGPQSVTTDTVGTTFTCTATSAGGTSTASVTVKRDATAPYDVGYTVEPAGSPVGTHAGPFTATWHGSDDTSGVSSCTATTYAGPDTNTGSLAGSCTDEAGNNAAGPAYGFTYDSTAPTIVGTPRRGPDSNGWYNHPVTIDWAAPGDTGSSVTCDEDSTTYGDETLEPDSANAVVEVTCSDAAGNEGTGSYTLQFDATAPVPSIAAATDPNANDWYNTPVTATTTGQDDTSGSVTCTAPQTYGDDAAEGDTASGTLQGTCADAAGNTSDPAELAFKYDATAPTATATLSGTEQNGWYRGSVHTSVTGEDNLSGIDFCSPDPDYSGPDGANLALGGTCTDEAGNTSLRATATFNYDATAPTITFDSRTAANGHGWNNSAVTVRWACDDETSGETAPFVEDTLTDEGSGQTAHGTCVDLAGNEASDSLGDVDIDLTAPAAPSAAPDRAPDFGDWFRDNVTVTFSDNGDVGEVQSGVDPDSVPAPETFSASGEHTATGTVLDRAANESAPGSATVKVDATDPSLDLSCPPSVELGESASASWTASDEHSGVSGSTTGTVPMSSTTVGPRTATSSVGDNVGHTTSDSCDYSVVYGWNGFLQPINDTAHTGLFESKFKLGSTVPVKFRVTDHAGNPVQASGTPQFQVSANRGVCDTAGTSEASPDTTASAGTAYKWSSADSQYVYNFSTKGRTNGEYRVWATGIGDGTNHYVDICLVK